MIRLLIAAILCAASTFGQSVSPVGGPEMSDAEQDSLRQALGEAGASPIDFVRALEGHLAKYPNSSRRPELERALVKSAIDLKDSARIIRWGEKVLEREPDDPQVLEKVAVARLQTGDSVSAERALIYIRRYKKLLADASLQGQDAGRGSTGKEAARLKDGADRARARALILEARAEGLLEHKEKAVAAAQASYQAYPSVEGAREASRWLAANGQDQAAIQYLAQAFSIAELKATDPDASRDRVHLGELYRKLNGSEAGLGDLILKSYDQTSTLFSARREQMHKFDPNADVKDPMDFTLSSVDGEKLRLSSLRGKVVVMDFWATWCGPCRVQHPLYEQVKAKFKDRLDVVFLSVDTDENRGLVQPFLEQAKWNQRVYFEDGLGQLLQVSSIPTTVIFGKKGEVASRLNGFLPDRFVDMLTERIRDALQELPPKTEARNVAKHASS